MESPEKPIRFGPFDRQLEEEACSRGDMGSAQEFHVKKRLAEKQLSQLYSGIIRSFESTN
jgi:hypothetical protein